MRLYLVQHGLVLPGSEDPKRGLTDKGIVQTQKMGEFLRHADLGLGLIWHSRKLRALQTAQIFSKSLPDAEVIGRNNLAPQDPVDKFPQEIEGLDKDLMIVGHLPFLQKLAAKLLTKSTHLDLIAFENSGIVCLEYKDTWKLSWKIDPELYL